MNPTMNANDAVYGSLAECYVTIDGNRYNMMQLYDFESSAAINLIDVPILGRTGKGKKPRAGRGHGKGQHIITSRCSASGFCTTRKPAS